MFRGIQKILGSLRYFSAPNPSHCYVNVAFDDLELTGFELLQHLQKWVLFEVWFL